MQEFEDTYRLLENLKDYNNGLEDDISDFMNPSVETTRKETID